MDVRLCLASSKRKTAKGRLPSFEPGSNRPKAVSHGKKQLEAIFSAVRSATLLIFPMDSGITHETQ